MPLKMGRSPQTVSENVKEMMRSGHGAKQAVGAAMAMKRKTMKKMAEGGMVKEGDYDLGEEHPRGLEELMIEGDQPPVANPEVMSHEMTLARKLQKAEEMEMYAMGGLVQDGPAGDEPVGNKPSEDMSSTTEEPMSSEVMRMSSGGMALSKEQMMALEEKKKKRKFMK